MKRKLDVVRSKKVSDFPVLEIRQQEMVEATREVKDEVKQLWQLLNDKEEYDFDVLKDQLETLHNKLDFSPILRQLDLLNKKEIGSLAIKDFTKLLEAIEKNKPLEIDLSKLEKAIIRVEQRIQENVVETNQAPDEFQPVRRVVKVGNKLVYDDQPTPSRGGGGSGGTSSSSSSSGLTDDQLRATPVPVSGAFYQATQPVSGTFWQATQPVSVAATITTKETRSSTPTQTSVADTASSTTLIASNANRLGATIFNDSTVALYVKLGATASTTSFTIKLDANDYYEIPFGYTGVVDGIWASDASGSARITELT